MFDLFVLLSNSPAANGSANIASLIGLVVTLFIFWRVAAIRRSFLVRARLPQLATDLRKHLNALGGALADYGIRKERFLEEIYPCASTLRWMRPMIKRSVRGSWWNAVWKLWGFRYFPVARSESRARLLYNSLLEFENDARNLIEQTKWE